MKMKASISVLQALFLCVLANGAATPASLTNLTFTTLKSFGVFTNITGWGPAGPLVQGADGAIYGAMTEAEGNVGGTIFKAKRDGTDFKILKAFTNYHEEGIDVSQELALAGSTLYGTTYRGGSGLYGTLFRMNTDGTDYTVIRNFSVEESSPSGLTLDGTILYGTTYGDCAFGDCCSRVYKVNTDGTGYTVLKVLSLEEGQGPKGSLLLSGNTLYGTTAYGGSSRGGTLFRVNTDGSEFAVLKHLTNHGGIAGLTLSANTLYGITDNMGTRSVFKMKTDGTEYTVLKSFTAGEDFPHALTLSGNVLYGSTFRSVFMMDTNGTSFAKIFTFGEESILRGSLSLLGDFIYGTAFNASSPNGTIFMMNTDGTGYTVLRHLGASDGIYPTGVTILGKTLYGVTSDGGSSGWGTLFKINTDGSGYTVLRSFTLEDAANPTELFRSGKTLYGTFGDTYGGGIFRVHTNGTGFRIILRHDSEVQKTLVFSGSSIFGSIISDESKIFKMNIDGTGFTILKAFPWPVKLRELAYSDGLLYGIAGRREGGGVLFVMKPDGDGYTVMKDFDSTAESPTAFVISGSTIYGTTDSSLFKLNTDGTSYTIITPSLNTYDVTQLALWENTLYGASPESLFSVKIDGSGPTDSMSFPPWESDEGPEHFVLSRGAIYSYVTEGGDLGTGMVLSLTIGPEGDDPNEPDVEDPNDDTSFEWAKHVGSTSDEDDELSIGLTADAAGNLYVTGWFDGANDFGGIILTNQTDGGQDIFVAKYNSVGDLEWARRAGGSTSERDAGRSVAVDGIGNLYVTGEFVGRAVFDEITLNAPANKECFLVKYSSTGTVIWARQSSGGTSSGVYGTGLAVDAEGNSHVVGFADNGAAITFGQSNLLSAATTGYSAFLAKYDSAGDLLWAQLLGGSGRTYATKIAVDHAGNVYVRGSFSEDLNIGNTNLVSSIVEGSDMFVAKFSSDGALSWVQRSINGGVDEGGVAVDQSGNIYVSGWFENTINLGGVALTNAGSGDAFIAKYNTEGALQWARRAGGTGIDLYWDVALDQAGFAYVAGHLSSDASSPNGAGGAVVAKYSPSGTLLWANSAIGASADPVSSFAAKCMTDRSGNCYAAGWYRTRTDFGTSSLSPVKYWNMFVTKVSYPPLLLAIRRTDSLPRLVVSGETNTRVAIDYASTMGTNIEWENWETNVITSIPLTVPDTNAFKPSRRFYRARLVP